MEHKFTDMRRDEIYRAVTLRRAIYNMTLEELLADMTDRVGQALEESTMKRFLNRSRKTSEQNMMILHLYAESLPEIDPVYALGDGFAEFFELPQAFAERKAYMARMADQYAGTYDIWDITRGEVDPDVHDAILDLTTQAGSAFLLAKESGMGMREDGTWWRSYEGIAVPREDELTVFLKEVPVQHEKIYMLRCVTDEESKGEDGGRALYGNAMQKRLEGDRAAEPQGPMADFFRILMRKRKELSDEEWERLKDAAEAEAEEREQAEIPIEDDGFEEIP